MTTADDGTDFGVPDRPHAGPETDLARRVAELEATVARLTTALERQPAPTPSPAGDLAAVWAEALPRPADDPAPPVSHLSAAVAPESPAPTVDGPGPDGPSTGEPNGFDRRRLLSRAGTAAVGAVIGGAAASIAAASPAAAASASFDTSTSTPAVDAVSTGTGPAIRATNATIGGLALDVAGPVHLKDSVAIGSTAPPSGTDSRQVRIDSDRALGIEVNATHTGILASGGSVGVMGESVGSGLVGLSVSGIGMVAAGGRAGIQFRPYSAPVSPPPTQTIAHEKGDVVFDQNRDLWLCTADGTPGTWVRLGGAGTTGAFTALANPVRVYDSRPNQAPADVLPKTPLAGGTPRSIDLTKASSGVPTDATAAVVTATVTATTGGSPNGPAYLALYRDGTAWPGTSTVNWTAPGSTIATTTVVPLGPGAKLAAYAATPTDLIIDVVGYYR